MIKLEIDQADGRGRVDYTRYVAPAERTPMTLRDRVNMPALLDFTLVPADEYFVPPRRSAYVRLTGLADAQPPGGPRVPGPLFTGFITNEPGAEFLGISSSRALHGYRCQATSEDYLLNVKRIGPLPTFLNQTAGQILRFLTERLQPGRFDTSGVADGPLVPSFTAPPEESWSEIARELAERSGYAYRVLDARIYFAPLADQDAGVAVDERDSRFRPEALEITPLGNPIRNDVTVYGELEPSAYVKEYFVGDGFTSRFSLASPVYGAASSLLLSDDFTSVEIDSTRWLETDPLNFISMFEGRLNITGGTGTLNETTLLARQAIELGGELELTHGEFEFVAASAGILGGIYGDAALTDSNCLLGFDVSPIAGSSRIRARIQGAVQPSEVVVQPGFHYVLATRISADQIYRTQQIFPSMSGTFGGESVAVQARVRLEVQAIELADPAEPETVVLHEATLGSLPEFAYYAPVNSASLHAVMNFLQVARPIQAVLETQLPGESARERSLGFGIATHDATIAANPNNNRWSLEFYEDTIPARGEKITVAYRAAARARARVIDAVNMATEASLAGDDGRRAAVLRDVQPAPRTSEEAELAALAYLADHSAPRYEGRYTTWGEFADGFPRAGSLLEIHNHSRQPIFTTLVRAVSSEFRELHGEHILHTLEFGQPSRFEDLLKHFAPPENALRAEEESSLEATDVTEVGTSFQDDAPGFRIASFSSTHYQIDMGAQPSAGVSFEVRRSNQGWSTPGSAGSAQNLLANFSSQTFLLPRSARTQNFYIRPVAADGATSRNSSIIAIHYPGVPAAPQSAGVRFGLDEQQKPIISIVVELAEASIADVEAVELRDDDNLAVLARWEFGQLQFEGGVYRASLQLDNSTALLRAKTVYAYTQNALGEYSAATSASGSQPVPTKPLLAGGNSVGQILEILLDAVPDIIEETEIQVAVPGGSFTSPAQSVSLPGQPRKFNFVATQSGDWSFRARRRDVLGWSPWSNETQGQIPAQIMLFEVRFFRAPELDPSIGAAVNPQNLLPNSEFFLGGIGGQEGTHAARYFGLVNAATDGSEVDHLATTNEMQWKSGVNFGAANPGFRSVLSNMGRLLNPGETLTLCAALRHTGSGAFANAVRFALRSPGTPAYDQSRDIPSGSLPDEYRWYAVTFTLPVNQSVPADLAVEIATVVSAGQSLASDLFCDKVVLSRGHRPAAFSTAPWDVVSLAWNSGTGSYDLPAGVAGGLARSSDPGSAGRLSGTGTEDLDPDFTDRYTRLTA